MRTEDGCVCLAGRVADEPVLVPEQARQGVDVLLGQPVDLLFRVSGHPLRTTSAEPLPSLCTLIAG